MYYRYAVCEYDEHLISHNSETDESNVKEVFKVFDNYEEAWEYYMTLFNNYRQREGTLPKNIWIAWINKNDKVIQFDRLKMDTFSRYRNIEL